MSSISFPSSSNELLLSIIISKSFLRVVITLSDFDFSSNIFLVFSDISELLVFLLLSFNNSFSDKTFDTSSVIFNSLEFSSFILSSFLSISLDRLNVSTSFLFILLFIISILLVNLSFSVLYLFNSLLNFSIS